MDATHTHLIHDVMQKADSLPSDLRHDIRNLLGIYQGLIELGEDLDADGAALLHRVHDKLERFLES